MFTLASAKNNNKGSREKKKMKIKCDVCDKSEATVFCSADEAALCDACDSQVHRANKLASKHPRFSLLQPSSKQSPLCDICQERRAFLFCQEDRAILCRECDIPIHDTNEYTKKHNRFLLTGVKLSTCHPPPSSSSNSYCDSKKNTISNKKSSKQQHHPYPHNNTPTFSNEMFSSSAERASSSPSSTATYNNNNNSNFGDNVSISTSSISEYLETVPGWRIDDFLDSTDGFCKSLEKFWPLVNDHRDLRNQMVSFSSGDHDSNFWVPHDQFLVYSCLLPKSSITTAGGGAATLLVCLKA